MNIVAAIILGFFMVHVGRSAVARFDCAHLHIDKACQEITDAYAARAAAEAHK